MIYVVALLLSFSIALILIPKILLISVRKGLLDVPNSRKVHRVRASRLGGIAFFPGIFLTVCVIGMYQLWTNMHEDINGSWLILSLGAAFLMYIIGAVDDIKGMRCRVKLGYQVLTAIMIVLSGSWVNSFYGLFGICELPVWVGIPFTIVLVVFIINAINLIDGIDGLSSGLGILILSVYFGLFLSRGEQAPALFSIASIGVLIGFFRYNFWGFGKHPIKIFMGDSGALLIGTVISILTLRLLHRSDTPGGFDNEMVALIVFSVLVVPCFDVLRVMLYRYRSGIPLFRPDKSHIHHKLLALGCSATQALFVILGISFGIVIVNFLLCYLVCKECIILFDVLLWVVFNALITYRIQKRQMKYENKEQYDN